MSTKSQSSRVAVFSLSLAAACVATAAEDVTIPAPGGVGDVAALVSALESIDSYRDVLLEPGVYDLKDQAMNEDSHLVLQKGGHRLVGLGSEPGETVLLGGGAKKGKRIMVLKGTSASSLACVTNLTLTGGYTAKNGGAFVGNNFAHALGCVISNNYATGTWQEGGGAIEIGFARGCYFADNRTDGVNGHHGGAMWCNNADYQGAVDCVFTNNYGYQGGGIYGAVARNCTFVGNKAAGGGGGASGTAVRDCTFIQNNGYWGGGVDTPSLASNCVFVGNWARAPYRENSGGAAFSSGGSTFIDCHFTNNTCTGYSGTLQIHRSAAPVKTVRVVNCDFVGGTAGYYGGAIYQDAYTWLEIEGCHFATNVAQKELSYAGSGGAVYMSNGYVSNCTFEGNEAQNNNGGAIYAGTGVALSNCTFTANKAKVSGGAVRTCAQDCHRCTFVDNSAKDGAGLYLEVSDSNVTFRAEKCTFAGNRASGNGGGAYAPGGFFGCTFVTNVATGTGGAIYADRESTCGPISNCVVRGNSAGTACAIGTVESSRYVTVIGSELSCNTNGGASVVQDVTFRDSVISNHHTTAWVFRRCNFFGCLVADNRTPYSSGGVSVDTGDLTYTNANSVFEGNYQYINAITEEKTVVNCTYVGNRVDSGSYGDIVRPGAMVYNTVFVDNTYNGTLRDFRKGEYPTMANCTYSHIVDSELPAKCTGCFAATRSQLKLSRDPLTPYAPRVASPLKDAALEEPWILAALGEKDVYGKPRVRWGGLDIGAAEFQDPTSGLQVLIR